MQCYMSIISTKLGENIKMSALSQPVFQGVNLINLKENNDKLEF